MVFISAHLSKALYVYILVSINSNNSTYIGTNERVRPIIMDGGPFLILN